MGAIKFYNDVLTNQADAVKEHSLIAFVTRLDNFVSHIRLRGKIRREDK